jgi:agmatinase
MFRPYHLLFPTIFAIPAIARDITFPPVSGFSSDQVNLGFTSGPEINYAKFAGLSTYANLPYVHCLAPEEEEVEKFDIAILGAPFDTVC